MQDSKQFYRRKSTDWITGMDISCYILLIDATLFQENERCTACLNAVTRPKLVRTLLEECIVAHADAIFDAVKDILRSIYDNTQVTVAYSWFVFVFCLFETYSFVSFATIGGG